MRELRELKVLLHACADVTRLRILRLLADGAERSVTDLTADLRLSQPLVSWHLRILRRAGLIAARRTGRQALYCLNHSGWSGLTSSLDQFLLPGSGWTWSREPPARLPALRRQGSAR